ncbi:hypothetical protein [Desulfosarcina sp. BuS5]|uniref:hypothetical protein n=1 Tax=Desulfosarcina sp. BuS5 TaxID=933262 RepID=UPI0018DBC096|nr:hypothetical protein [Desulfosarcina sp. BuS5]
MLGGGGHYKACIDVIEQDGRFRIAGIVDLPDKLQNRVLDHQIFASDKDLPFLLAAVLLVVKDGVIQSVAPQYRTDAILRRINQDRYPMTGMTSELTCLTAMTV